MNDGGSRMHVYSSCNLRTPAIACYAFSLKLHRGALVDPPAHEAHFGVIFLSAHKPVSLLCRINLCGIGILMHLRLPSEAPYGLWRSATRSRDPAGCSQEQQQQQQQQQQQLPPLIMTNNHDQCPWNIGRFWRFIGLPGQPAVPRALSREASVMRLNFVAVPSKMLMLYQLPECASYANVK